MKRKTYVKYPALAPVELLMAVEEFFGLRIPDDDGARMYCLADLKRYVWERVAHGRHGLCRTQRCFYRLRRDVCALLGLQPSEVRPGTTWRAILGGRGSRRVWRSLRKMRAFPRECWRISFCWPGLLISAAFIGAGIGFFGDLLAEPGRVSAHVWAAICTCTGALVGWASAFRCARPRFRTTLGESARLLAAREYPLQYPSLTRAPGPWSFDEVGAVVERLAMEAARLEDLNDIAGITD